MMKKTAPTLRHSAWRFGPRLSVDKWPRSLAVWPVSGVELVGCSRHRRRDISMADRGCQH
jgi:hypothetical protein